MARKTGGWLAVTAVVLLAGLFLFFTRGGGEPVRAAIVRQEPLVSSLTTNGKVEPRNSQEIRAAAPGFVRRLHVKEGDRVRRGQLLVELDIGESAAEVARARAELEAAEAEAQMVQKGGSGAELLDTERKLRDARAVRDEAARELAANERLLKANAISRADVDASRERLLQAEREIAFLDQRSRRSFTAADRERVRARVNSARAALAYASRQAGSARVAAPVAGTAYSVPVQTGNFVNTGDLIARVGNLDQVRVVVYVDEPELGRVAPGQEIRVTWSALPGNEWKGVVERIPAEVTTLGTRSVGQVICTVDNRDRKLLASVNVDVELVVQRRPAALTLPKEAVIHDGEHSGEPDSAAGMHHVYVVDDDRLRRRNVKLGVSNATRVEIASGLSGGDRVALPGDRTLHEGMKVRVRQ